MGWFLGRVISVMCWLTSHLPGRKLPVIAEMRDLDLSASLSGLTSRSTCLLRRIEFHDWSRLLRLLAVWIEDHSFERELGRFEACLLEGPLQLCSVKALGYKSAGSTLTRRGDSLE